MRLYVSFNVLMRSHGIQRVLMFPNSQLIIGPYRSLCVPIGPCVPSLVIIRPYGSL